MKINKETSIKGKLILVMESTFLYLGVAVLSAFSFLLGKDLLPQAVSKIGMNHADIFVKIILIGTINTLLFIQIFSRPKIPEIKPVLLLPNYDKKIFRQIIISNLASWSNITYYTIILSLFTGGLWGIQYFLEIIPAILLCVLLTLSLRINCISLKLALRYLKRKYLIIFYSLSIIIIFLIPISIVNIHYLISTILAGIISLISILVFNTNALPLFRYAFDNIEVSNPLKTLYYPGTMKLNFYSKEFRMLARSKRLKTLFFLMIAYFLISFIILIFSDRMRIRNVFLYLSFCGLSVFPDYLERLWAWDHKNRGLILSFPSAAGKYFHQKIYFAFVLHISVIIISMAFFQDYPLIGALLSILSIIALVIIGGYKSFSNYDMNTDLYCSIYEAKRRKWNKWLPMVVIPVFLLNGYFLEHIAATGLLTLYIFLLATLDISFFASLRRKYKLLEY